MAQLALSDLLTQVRQYIPGKLQAAVAAAANMTLIDLYGEVTFHARTTYTLRAPYSTGTVSVTGGGATTSVVGSGTTWSASWGPCLIRIQGEDTWFLFTPSGATAGALSSAWNGATGSGLTYEIVFPFVSFPAAVLMPVMMRIEGDEPLRWAASEANEVFAQRISPARPTHFSIYAPDQSAAAPSDDLFRIQLRQPPDDDYVLQVEYEVRPTYYVAATASSVPGLPDAFNKAILYGTLMHCWDQEDKQDRSAVWERRYAEAKTKIVAKWHALVSAQIAGGGGSDFVWNDAPWGSNL